MANGQLQIELMRRFMPISVGSDVSIYQLRTLQLHSLLATRLVERVVAARAIATVKSIVTNESADNFPGQNEVFGIRRCHFAHER